MGCTSFGECSFSKEKKNLHQGDMVMCRYIKSKISVVITAILTGVLLLTSCNGSTNEQIISMSENNYVKMVSENEDSNIQVKTEPSSNDPGIEPDSVQKHLLYGDELEKYEADIYEKHCAAAYEKRCKMYNLDMSDYSKYNDWSEISVKGDSWKDAYIDLIDEVVGYTVTDYLYGSPYLPCRFLFSLLFLNDDETPELEIDLLLQGEDDRIIYSFDGEKTVFSDCLVENKFVSYYLYKDFILVECISDMSECQYTFYNTNDDLKFEEDVTLGYYSTWNEDEGIYEEHYSFSTGPDGEKKRFPKRSFSPILRKRALIRKTLINPRLSVYSPVNIVR